jgi:putative ABC transport system permease protein
MKKSLIKNTLREILGTKARFFSIMAIIGLGVGFLSGVKSTSPSMLKMAENYYSDTNLMDFRLISPIGFDDDDINAVSATENVTDVMPSYFTDVTVNVNGTGAPVRVIAMPYSYKNNETLNTLTLVDGRMPKNNKETVIDADGLKSYKIGETIKIDKIVNNEKTSDTLKSLEYKIVGTVRTSMNISFERGTTTVGDGKLRGFIYINKDCFKTEKYTELYVKTTYSTTLSPFDSEYDKKINSLTKTLKNVGEVQVQSFLDSKQSDLDKSTQEYNNSKKETQEKLTSAKNKITASEKKLKKETANAKSKIEKAQQEYSNGLSEYYSSKEKYQNEIAKAEKQLKESKAKLKKSQATYEKNKKKFDKEIKKAKTKLDKAKSDYKENYNTFYKTTKPQAGKQILTLNNAVKSLNTSIESIEQAYALGAYDLVAQGFSQISTALEQLGQEPMTSLTAELIADPTVYNTALEQVKSAVTELNTNAKNAEAQLTKGESELKKAKSEINKAEKQYKKESKQGKEKLNKAKTQLEKAKEKIKQGDSQLKTSKEEGKLQLATAYEKLEKAKAQIDSSKETLKTKTTEGKQKIKNAKAKLAKSQNKAEKELNNAEEKLNSAQEQLNKYQGKSWYVNTRDDNAGYSSFYDNCQRVDNVAGVFPIFFLLVAILVCVTTMTRLIDEKRTEIGTLKALGYSNRAIMMKYIAYASISSIIGSVIGILIGVPILPAIIYNAYKIMYYMPDIKIIPNTGAIIVGILVAVLCTISVAIYTCYKALKENSASLMRPKSPKAGTRIILEKIGFIWKRFGFTSKVTARNIFRYKARFMMTVLGVAGCTALILAGLYLHDSIADIVNVQYTEIFSYDAVIVNKNEGTEKELESLTSVVNSDSRISDNMLYANKSITATHKDSKVDTSLYLFVPSSQDKLQSLITLRNRTTGDALKLNNTGVIITEKLSKLLNVKTGDTITLNHNNQSKSVKVSDITEHYVYNFIYMSPNLYKNTFGEDIKYNMLMLKIPNLTDDEETEIGNEYLKNNDVTAISFNSQGITNFNNTVKSLDMVVMVMIICAGLLAFVVLYNLTNINIAERQREIATLKVLGFYNKETSAYIYRENIVLTILGIILGLVLGVFLGYFIVITVEIESVMFGRTISLLSFICASLLTGVFSFIVNLIMHFKMKKIDMIESLKSIE